MMSFATHGCGDPGVQNHTTIINGILVKILERYGPQILVQSICS